MKYFVLFFSPFVMFISLNSIAASKHFNPIAGIEYRVELVTSTTNLKQAKEIYVETLGKALKRSQTRVTNPYNLAKKIGLELPELEAGISMQSHFKSGAGGGQVMWEFFKKDDGNLVTASFPGSFGIETNGSTACLPGTIELLKKAKEKKDWQGFDGIAKERCFDIVSSSNMADADTNLNDSEIKVDLDSVEREVSYNLTTKEIKTEPGYYNVYVLDYVPEVDKGEVVTGLKLFLNKKLLVPTASKKKRLMTSKENLAWNALMSSEGTALDTGAFLKEQQKSHPDFFKQIQEYQYLYREFYWNSEFEGKPLPENLSDEQYDEYREIVDTRLKKIKRSVLELIPAEKVLEKAGN